MRNTVRLLLACIPVLAVSGFAAASNYRDVQKAVGNDEILITAGVEPDKAEMRLPCSGAVIVNDEPESFDCVYVQTGHALNLFSLEDGYLMSELQMTVGTMDGVALQRLGRYTQVQVFSGNRVAAFYVYDDAWFDEKKTEAVYQWFIDHGVPPREPQKWIGR
jgi:hypothetical protein